MGQKVHPTGIRLGIIKDWTWHNIPLYFFRLRTIRLSERLFVRVL